MVRSLIFICVNIVFITIIPCFGQSPEEEIENLVRDYGQAYENLTKSRDKESVLQYVSTDLFSTIIKSNVVDNFGLIKSTYADFDAYLDRLLLTDGLTIQYEIIKILESRVRGNSGVVICDVAVKVVSRGEVWNSGTEFTTFTLKKFPDGWKILNFNVVSLEEEQNRGTCLTEVFKGSAGNYLVKTIVPVGATYQTNINNFVFNQGSNIVFISLDGVNTYSWKKDGPVTKLARNGEGERVIASAVNEDEVVYNIISLDLYPTNCVDFKVKN
ncbi:MAG: nuclear transport factor 2 family protein [Cyclobacteriaceae bacterium]|nr:nuclear transport factor 2 family protein [Cyclobacteriaceae bacterium]